MHFDTKKKTKSRWCPTSGGAADAFWNREHDFSGKWLESQRGRVAVARQYRRDAVRAAGAAWVPERTHVSGGGGSAAAIYY